MSSRLTPRMTNPALSLPGVMPALLALSGTIEKAGLPATTHELVKLRASQINGCAVCLHMHAAAARKAGETDERLATLAGWRDTPYFTDAERAALDLTECVTRIGDRSDPVPDEVWVEAARHFDEPVLAALVLAIANINVWNRITSRPPRSRGPSRPARAAISAAGRCRQRTRCRRC